ncbi:MAG: hypothetical protein HGN29_17400 [Asgard group archaeon]|nr:hypothetical protein [Asgard group archaeon]
MTEEKKSKIYFLGIYPKCPFYKPLPVFIILVIIALGTWGSYYLHRWAAVAYVIYSILFYFLVMPFTMCRYCYFKAKETPTDEEKEKPTVKLMTIDKWSKTLLHKHVGQKHWAWVMFVVWILPVILIITSFFRNFNYLAIIALVAFILAVVGNYIYMIKVKCPTCPIREECHSSF